MIDTLTEVERTLARVRNGEIEDAIAEFAETFVFNDRGIGLEFDDRGRLRGFLEKERDLYPDLSFRTRRLSSRRIM